MKVQIPNAPTKYWTGAKLISGNSIKEIQEKLTEIREARRLMYAKELDRAFTNLTIEITQNNTFQRFKDATQIEKDTIVISIDESILLSPTKKTKSKFTFSEFNRVLPLALEPHSLNLNKDLRQLLALNYIEQTKCPDKFSGYKSGYEYYKFTPLGKQVFDKTVQLFINSSKGIKLMLTDNDYRYLLAGYCKFIEHKFLQDEWWNRWGVWADLKQLNVTEKGKLWVLKNKKIIHELIINRSFIDQTMILTISYCFIKCFLELIPIEEIGPYMFTKDKELNELAAQVVQQRRKNEQ